MSSFKALMVHRDEDKTIRHEMTELQHGDLPADGEVLVAVKYSTVNYKDGLCLSGKGGLVRNYPHIPGIDFAGEVVSSSDKRYKQGDLVALTGWRVGEIWWGGYAQFAKVRADWLVPLVASSAAMSIKMNGALSTKFACARIRRMTNSLPPSPMAIVGQLAVLKK
jgi:acrylyl-CoA reductase (NADPH)